MIRRIACFLLLSISFFGLANSAQVVIGNTETIESKVLNETRKISVSLPEDYSDNDYHYPVLYFSDSEAHFATMASTVKFLAKNNVVPPIIVVGIHSGSTRTRDLTPALSKNNSEKKSWYSDQNPGGADEFIQFFVQELFPYVDNKYRTADFKVFSGHSFGGLLSIYTYLTQPDLFDGYIAVSPSLWWDDEKLVADVTQLVEANKLPKKRLFLSKGNEQGPMDTAYKSMVDLFESYNANQTSSQAFPEENHLTVVFKAHYHGLRGIFNDWELPFKQGAKGIEVVKAHNQKVKQTFNVNFGSEGWLINLGNSERYKKNYDKAIEAYQYNISLFPNSAYSYFLLAKTYEDKNELKTALEKYQQANQMVPSSSPYKQKYIENVERVKSLL